MVQIAVGAYHSMALLKDGTVLSWGIVDDNGSRNPAQGQGGDPLCYTGATNMVPQRTRVGLSTGGVYLNNILSISVEGDTNVALRNDGTVFTWGRNSNGQGGDGTTVLKRYPNPVLTSVSNDGVTLRSITSQL